MSMLQGPIESTFAICIMAMFLTRAVMGAFNYQALINKSGEKIVAVTTDTNQATIVTYDGQFYNVALLNLQTNSYGILIQNSPVKINTITEIKGYNTPAANMYMLGNESKYWIVTNNLSSLVKSFGVTGEVGRYKALFGANTTCYFEMIQDSKQDIQLKQVSMSGAYIFNYTESSETGLQIQYMNNKILMLTWTPSNLDLIVLSIPGKSEITTINNLQLPDSINTKISSSNPYIAFASAKVFQVYSTANYGKIWGITLGENITGIKLSNLWAFVATNTTLYQYYIGNGSQVCNISHTVINANVNVGELNGTTWLTLWSVNSTQLQVYTVVGGVVSNLANATVISVPASSNITNSSNTTNNNTTNNITNSTNSNNSTNSTNQANSTNSTNQTSSNSNSTTDDITAILPDYPQCILYNDQNQCVSFCPFPCSVCSVLTGACLACKTFYELDEHGGCRLEASSTAIMVGLAAANTIRINSLQRVYFLIDDFKFHQHHNTNYTGILAQVLEIITIFQANFWTLINAPTVVSEMHKPFDLPSYSSFTNPKFMQVLRSDSFFLQNTKEYFLLFIPTSVVIFVILNRLFYLVYRFRFSIALRFYSFGLSLVMVLVGQNLTILTFYACHHLRNLFSFNSTLYFLQAFTVTFLGLCFILMISYFLMCKYFYGKKSRIFLVNLYRTKGSFGLIMLRYVIKPFIQTAVHALMYENYTQQIFIIAIVDVICFGCSGAFQLLIGASKTKVLFVADCIFDFSLAAINFTLYFKQVAYPQLNEQFEYFIKTFIYIIVSVMGFYVLYSTPLIIQSFLKAQTQFITEFRAEKQKRDKEIHRPTQVMGEGQKSNKKKRRPMRPTDIVITNLISQKVQNKI